jgi:archaeal cell division control protein 6
MVVKLDKIFDSAIKNTIFKDKMILQSNYDPQTIPHRDKEIEQIASILAPSLKGERPSNLFVYGKTGSGKTLSVKYVKEELLKRAASSSGKLRIEYLNCKLRKVSDTEYRILAEFIKKLGGEVPATGLPTDAVYNKFIELVDKEKQLLILVLDEVDQAVKKISDGFLYNLTRLNAELTHAQISLVGISNNLRFLDDLDPRVRSSLSEEEIIFKSYNALQLQDILKNRSERAFNENMVSEGVIEKCAAFAARDHGDARRALDLLRVAGEIAEREGESKIKLAHIDLANNKIERDKILDDIESEPKQFQLTLLAIMELLDTQEKVFTGEVYKAYQDICKKTNTEVLTQRRVSSIISEFDMAGLINAKNISRGTYGKTREIRSAIPKQIEVQAKNILKESLSL